MGTLVEGKIRNLTEFGAFVEITEEIDGLIHVSDMSWTKRIKHPSEVLQKGGFLGNVRQLCGPVILMPVVGTHGIQEGLPAVRQCPRRHPSVFTRISRSPRHQPISPVIGFVAFDALDHFRNVGFVLA